MTASTTGSNTISPTSTTTTQPDNITSFATAYARLMNTLLPGTNASAQEIAQHLQTNPDEAARCCITDNTQAEQTLNWLGMLNDKLDGISAAAATKFVENLTAGTNLENKDALLNLAVNRNNLTVEALDNLIKTAAIQANPQTTKQPIQQQPIDPSVTAALDAANRAAHANEQEHMAQIEKHLQAYSGLVDAAFAKLDAAGPGWRDRMYDTSTTPPQQITAQDIKGALLKQQAVILSERRSIPSDALTYLQQQIDAINSISAEEMSHHLRARDIDLNSPNPLDITNIVSGLTVMSSRIARDLKLAAAARPLAEEILSLIPEQSRSMIPGINNDIKMENIARDLAYGSSHAQIATSSDKMQEALQGEIARLQTMQKQFSQLEAADKMLLLESVGLGSVRNALAVQTTNVMLSPIGSLGKTLNGLAKGELKIEDIRTQYAQQYAVISRRQNTGASTEVLGEFTKRRGEENARGQQEAPSQGPSL